MEQSNMRRSVWAVVSGGGLMLSLTSPVALADELQSQALPVAAQSASSGGSASDSATVPRQLEEIVVTATKREESSRKIPETVNVVKGKDLEEIGARQMEDYLNYVPGVTLQNGASNNERTLSIRGVGALAGGNQTVGVLINDVSMTDPYSSYLVPDLDPFDLKDIEVLKGPQGTLFGAAALNGALRYALNKPLLGEWEAKGFTDWLHIQGAGSGPTFGGAVNIPIGRELALRAVDVVQEVPGQYDDVNANGKNERDADSGYKRMHRFMGLWQPTERLSVNAFYLKQDAHANDVGFANNLSGQFVRTDTPGPSTSHQDFAVMNLDARYEFDWATLVSETSRSSKQQELDFDTSNLVEQLATAGVESARTYGLINSNSISQELRLVSAPSDSPWVWLGGLYYSRYRAQVLDNIYVANTQLLDTLLGELGVSGTSQLTPPPGGLSVLAVIINPLQAKEESVFGELTRKLFNNRVNITLGGRFYRENLLGQIGLGGVTAIYGSLNGYTGAKIEKAEGFNPKGSLTWQAAENVLWYATASHGFQFGGINSPAVIPTDNTFPLEFKPSTIWSYETGVRNDLFHKTLQIDATVFLLNWKDLQLPVKTQDGVTTYTANVSAARSKGIETSIRWRTFIPGLTWITTGSYIHAKVSAPYDPPSGSPIPVGYDLPAAPRLQVATTLSYVASLGPTRFNSAVTEAHQGHAFNDLTHDNVIYRYNTLSLNAGFTFPNLPFAPAVTINATNLNNTHALTGAQVNSLGPIGEATQAEFLRSRTIELRISGQL